MDSEKINQLIKLLNEHGLTEIEFSEGDQSIRIKRQLSPATHTTLLQPSPSNAIMPTQSVSPEAEVSGHKVRSPMVGTVYLAPKPDAEHFVKVNQTVKLGDVLCIVEAMKMLNQIEADKAGVIKARLVENGMPVEYNQPLFIIE
ncbi:acetyl-CoA carboxylase biotin carboxyl carrier protein [Rickettsiella endosymbiont of Aleochara curtula]|jgi:acetyl-CoA carboxylase biotin carboxyl carrier protein|uniref:acetyl-CoA carboxylase biotin carboxyl carrier protein n=1 Tax=Rickettsiella endosymbiont of Aleochara curtula TaxID=3077936 RepID=UPI00313AA33F